MDKVIMKKYLIPLTEEEIDELPFPETARKIGGIYVSVSDNLSEEDVEKIKDNFKAMILSCSKVG